MKNDEWRTPPAVFKKLHAEFDFDLDAAASAENTLCERYLSNALTAPDWPGHRIFLNPPYGKMIEPFMRKAAAEAAKGKLVVALVPLRMRSAWFHEVVVGRAVEVRAVRKRIKFLRQDGTAGKFTLSCDSMIIVWRGRTFEETKLLSWGFE